MSQKLTSNGGDRREIILVKHAAPEISREAPAARWRLSAAGRRSCADLAAYLWRRGVTHLVSSDEPKAIETAELAARRLGIGHDVAPDLHEQRRTTAPFFETEGAFEAAVRSAIARPDELVLGSETANAALARFAAAIDSVADGWSHPGPVCVVAHGTVIALFAAERAGADAGEMWSALGLPSAVRLADGAVTEVAGNLAPPANDAMLLAHYLARSSSESAWNHSSECAGIGYRLKQWLVALELDPASVCNVGIGEGSWDDFLGYQFAGAAITSVDIDDEICAMLAARQRREGHPNPATVLRADVLGARFAARFEGRFDLVTAVGSTVAETGDYGGALGAAVGALRPGGWLYYADLDQLHPARRFRDLASELGLEIAAAEADTELGVYAFSAKLPPCR